MRVDKKMVKFIVDTGADVTVITPETANRLGLERKPTKREFRGADGNKLNIKFRTHIPLLSEWGQTVKGRAYILEGAQNNLLGKPEISKLELVKTVRSISSRDIETRHPKLFGKLGVLQVMPLCLNVPSRLPIGLRQATQDE